MEGDIVVHTGLTYGLSDPVDVVVRKSAAGASTSPTAGTRSRPRVCRRGWQAVAEEVVGEHALNVNRRGVVFVQANEARSPGFSSAWPRASLALRGALEHE